jgi:preprotein translocase subunit SecE
VAPKKKRNNNKKKGSQQSPVNSTDSQGTSLASSEMTEGQDSPDTVQVMAAESSETDSDAGQKPKGPSPVGFVQGTKEELAKVVWPDRQQLISESAAVILMVSFLAIFISLIDNVFSWASQLVF